MKFHLNFGRTSRMPVQCSTSWAIRPRIVGQQLLSLHTHHLMFFYTHASPLCFCLTYPLLRARGDKCNFFHCKDILTSAQVNLQLGWLGYLLQILALPIIAYWWISWLRIPQLTNTQGLKITVDKVLPL